MDPTSQDPRVLPTPSANSQAQPRRAISAAYISGLHAVVDVVSVRFMGLVGLMGGIAIFGYAIYDPEKWRMCTAFGYGALVMWPLFYLYLKKD